MQNISVNHKPYTKRNYTNIYCSMKHNINGHKTPQDVFLAKSRLIITNGVCKIHLLKIIVIAIHKLRLLLD